MRTAILVDLENVVRPKWLQRQPGNAARADNRHERVTAQLVTTIESFAPGDEVIIRETFGQATNFEGWKPGRNGQWSA